MIHTTLSISRDHEALLSSRRYSWTRLCERQFSLHQARSTVSSRLVDHPSCVGRRRASLLTGSRSRSGQSRRNVKAILATATVKVYERTATHITVLLVKPKSNSSNQDMISCIILFTKYFETCESPTIICPGGRSPATPKPELPRLPLLREQSHGLSSPIPSDCPWHNPKTHRTRLQKYHILSTFWPAV